MVVSSEVLQVLLLTVLDSLKWKRLKMDLCLLLFLFFVSIGSGTSLYGILVPAKENNVGI